MREQSVEARIRKLRDDVIDEHEEHMISSSEARKFSYLAIASFSLIFITFFMVLTMLMSTSNSGFENSNIWDDYTNSWKGWLQGILSLILLVKGFNWLKKSNDIIGDSRYNVNHILYSLTFKKHKSFQNDLDKVISEYSLLSDDVLDNRFRESVKTGLEGSPVQYVHYMAMHKEFLNRFGFSPFHVDSWEDEIIMELKRRRSAFHE